MRCRKSVQIPAVAACEMRFLLCGSVVLYVDFLFLIRHNDVIISFYLKFVKDMFREGASESNPAMDRYEALPRNAYREALPHLQQQEAEPPGRHSQAEPGNEGSAPALYCSHRIRANHPVSGCNGQLVFNCLTDQHTVKRITVESWQPDKMSHATFIQRKRRNTMSPAPGRKICGRRFRKRQLSDLIFYNAFPYGYGTQKHFVSGVLYLITDRFGQTCVPFNIPQEYAGIQ